MTKSQKLAELTNLLFKIDDKIKIAKKQSNDLTNYFSLLLPAIVIKAQIEALNWVFDEDHFNKCPCCGSDKVYLTSAIHCSHCAVTTEI